MSNSTFFQKTTNVLPSLKPYYQWDGFNGQEFVSSTNNIFTDLNKDGFPDLIFHFWSGQNSENAGSVVTGGSPNRLVVLLSNGDGTYSDGTFTLTQNDEPIQLEGVSRKSLDHDFNADGYQDIFFAINREDGRSGQPSETNNAFSAAILSVGNGQYEIKNLGIENWYHSIGIIPSDTGVEVWLGGYSQSSGQIFKDATVQLASGFGYKLGDTQTSFSPVIQVPGHANTFTAIPNLLDLDDTKHVVSVVDIFSGGAGLGLFAKDSDNNWILSSTNFPHSSQTTVNFVSHSGNLGQTPVTELDGKVVLAIGHSASGVLQLFPDSPFIAGFKASGAVVANPRSDGAFYEQDAQPFSTIQFYSTENDTLTRLPITIVGEDQ
ncbi:MAG: VCBS repeat-containing protein, partial [Rhodospirillaceae bacterium]|nr:VCBS repeat-containing protein [Rhodospirillaceae bacterium]